MQQAVATLAGPSSKRRSYQIGDAIFAFLARFAGAFVLVLLGSLILSLLIGGLPAFRRFGFGFIGSTDWDPVQQVFGAAVSIYGTLVTSALALILAVPLAFGIAFYLTELAPTWLRRPVGTAVELLAAVPSIIYGMWGFFVIVPLMSQYIQPFVIDSLDGIPVLEDLFAGPPFGTGIFTAALILAVMVIPFIAATMRDVFETVPAVYKESAYGVGCTTWEVMRSIVLPYTRVSVVGGIMLGLGRALGETMAVTFVIGNTDRITTSLFGPGNTIASIVALEFPESPAGSLKLSSLLALGFILFVISFIVLAISRLLLRPRLKAVAMSSTIAGAVPGPARNQKIARTLGRRRHRANWIIKVLCIAATVIGLLFLASILATLIWRGAAGLSIAVFTNTTRPPGSNGGLLNAIVGTLIQTGIGTLIGTPIGLMVGTYLAEYGRRSPMANAVRFVSDVLLSAPSILIGLFIYQLCVAAVRRLFRHRRLPGAGGDRDPDRRAHHRGHAAAYPAQPARGGGGTRARRNGR